MPNASQVNDEVLMLYSDGTNGHLVAVALNAAATTFTAGQISVIDIANFADMPSVDNWALFFMSFA